MRFVVKAGGRLAAIVAAVLAAAPLPVSAGPLLDRVVASLDAVECEIYGSQPRAARALVAMSAWSGETLDRLFLNAGYNNLRTHVLDQGGFGSETSAQETEATERVIAAASAAADRLVADMERFGNAACPVLKALNADPLRDLVEKQARFRSFYHPYLITAQRLTALNGCGPDETDGAFGKASQEAWKQFADGVDRQAASTIPAPGDIVRLASVPLPAGACDTTSPRGSASIASLAYLWPEEYRRPLLELPNAADLLAFLDAAGRENHWPSYLRDMAMQLAPARDDADGDGRVTPVDAPAWLARMYDIGFGVETNPAAAAYWRTQGRTDIYEDYLAGLDDAAEAEAAASRIVTGLRKQYEYQLEGGDDDTETVEIDGGELPPAGFAGPILAPVTVPVEASSIAQVTWLARLAQRWPQVGEALTRDAPPAILVAVADRLLDSAGPQGRDAATAAKLLDAAQKGGDLYAQSRLAFLYRHGLGVARDPIRAIQLAGAAAERGEIFAMHLLSLFQEEAGSTDGALASVDAMLVRMAGLGGYTRPGTMLIVNRMIGSPELMAAGGLREGLGQLAGNHMELASALADLALCTSCGGIVDEAAAAGWLRAAQDKGSRTVAPQLFRLLRKSPELAASPDEPLQRLRQAIEPADEGSDRLFGYNTDVEAYLLLAAEEAGPPGSDARRRRLGEILDRLCAIEDASDCEAAATALATALVDPAFVADGYRRLRDAALVDVLAAYGDFEGALAELVRLAAEQGQLWEFQAEADEGASSYEGVSKPALRDQTFRRMTSAIVTGRVKEPPKGLVPLLRFLAQNGDLSAAGYLQAIEGRDTAPAEAVPPAAGDVDALRLAFDRQGERGGLSRAYVQAARDLSGALQASGSTDEALRLELTALSAELRLDDIAALSVGPIASDLTRVCHLSRASERAFALGSNDVATLIAKDAVNLLQGLRKNLSALPERLQGCFRDMVADHYRWLAQLFMQQERHDEAELVLGMLKDFEAFQFVGKDGDFARRTYEDIPLSSSERGFREQLAALVPPVTADAVRRLELRTKRQQGALSEAEAQELAAIEERLRAAEAAYRTALDGLMAAAGKLGRPDATTELEGLGQLRSYLRTDVEVPAAALHFVVLPDRIGVMLTTREGRIARIVEDWGGQRFSEALLDADIAALHARLRNPAADPRPEAKLLYERLIGQMLPEIEASGAKLLLLSLDRRLRYLPVPALHDGTHYLAERFEFATLSDAGFEVSGDKVTGAPIAALGMTKAAAGFAALPGVGLELGGLVQDASGHGLMSGTARLDEAFDKPALEDALLIGASAPANLGIVHISSHFALGKTDKDSFLLLGTGEQLSLNEIKDDTLAFDFGRVDLLTLSACETGFADAGADGRELESFSEITRRGGARAIVATLWPVQDKATALFMQRFYELRERGDMSKSAAMAVTQREFITDAIGSSVDLPGDSIVLETAVRGGIPLGGPPAADRPLGLAHPYYWAPFVLAGNWR